MAKTCGGVTELTLLKLDQIGEGHQSSSTVVHSGLEYWAGQGDSYVATARPSILHMTLSISFYGKSTCTMYQGPHC
jgi:hypothetical protein